MSQLTSAVGFPFHYANTNYSVVPAKLRLSAFHPKPEISAIRLSVRFPSISSHAGPILTNPKRPRQVPNGGPAERPFASKLRFNLGQVP